MNKLFASLFVFALLISVSFAQYSATGGNISTFVLDGINYTMHTFTANDNFVISGVIPNLTYLVVGGGGAGYGYADGGGGAGGLLYNNTTNLSGIIPVVVGAGGGICYGTSCLLSIGNGKNSSFGNFIAIGGGLGGIYQQAPSSGGSGGGGGRSNTPNNYGALGTIGQGNMGSNGSSDNCGGGGGGAGGVPSNCDGTNGANGGIGKNINLTGIIVCYAGGGGGGSRSGTPGIGTCGGANGTVGGAQGKNATDNLGGGGAGGASGGGAGSVGGSGVVIVRYATFITLPINFISSNPAAITSTNLFESAFEISYNITNGTSKPPILYHQTNSSTRATTIFINGNGYSGFQTNEVVARNVTIYSNNTTVTWNFTTDDNVEYPGTYNLNENITSNTPNIVVCNLNNQNDMCLDEVINFSAGTSYNNFEIYMNGTSVSNLYICNQNYNTTNGTKVTNDVTNCAMTYSIPANTPFNHTDNQSKYIVIPVAINTTTGKIAGSTVSITPKMYFVITKPTPTGVVTVYGVPINARNGVYLTTQNGGTNWISPNNATITAHLHQFSNGDIFSVYVVSNLTNGSTANSTITNFNIGLSPIQPTTPFVNLPISGLYRNNNSLFVNWSASQAQTGTLSNYTLQLYTFTDNGSTIYPIFDLNLSSTANLNYTWNTTFTANGTNAVYRCDSTNSSTLCRTYYGFVRVVANTIEGTSSYSDSTPFVIFDTNTTHYSPSQGILTPNYTAGEQYIAINNIFMPKYSYFTGTCPYSNSNACINFTAFANYSLNNTFISNMTNSTVMYSGASAYINNTIGLTSWVFDRGIRFITINNTPNTTASIAGVSTSNVTWNSYNMTFDYSTTIPTTLFDNVTTYYNNVTQSNQTLVVTQINISTNCTAPNKNILNFVFYDQNNTNTPTLSDMAATFQIYTINSTFNYSFNLSYSNVTVAPVCLNVPYGNYYINSLQTFKGINGAYRTLYYYFLNQNVSATTTLNTSLYNLLTSGSTATKLTILTGSNEPVVGYIQVYRYYPSLNQLLLVSMAKTDNNGNGETYVVPIDVTYQYVIIQNGNIIYTSPAATVPCDPASTLCTAQIFISSGFVNSYTYYVGNTQVGCTFNNVTRFVICTSNNPAGAGTTLTTNIYSTGAFSNTLVCTNTIPSGSGSVACLVPNTNATYYYQGYTSLGSNNLLIGQGIINPNPATAFGNFGTFGAIGMIIVAGGVGLLAGGAAAVFASTLGFVLAVWLNFLHISVVATVAITAVGIVVAAILYSRQ